MRIGIDARFLTHPQDGGFKTYTQNLVHGITAMDRSNEYFLYTDRPAEETAAFRGNIYIRPVTGQAVLREQVTLPLQMYRDGIDIAHYPCNTAPLLTSRRTVVTVHDVIPIMTAKTPASQHKTRKQKILDAYWHSVIPAAAKRATYIVTVSQSSKRDIMSLIGIPDERITVIPTGLHPDFRPERDHVQLHKVRDRYQLPERYVMGFASSDPRKNVEGLLQSMKIVKETVPDVQLALVSCSQGAWESVQELSQKVGVQPHVVHCPPRKDLAAIYTMADVLVFPSHYEGFGLPVVEAMACGTPVVTSNVSSLPEVAGGAALLIDPNDPGSIAEAAMKPLTDRYWREELIEKGFERASHFSWQSVIDRTVALYERVWTESLVTIRPQIAGGRP